MATIGSINSENTEIQKFKWQVENFLKRPEKNGETIYSPWFTIFDNCERQVNTILSLYPKGTYGYKDHVSVFISNSAETEEFNLTCR